MANIADIMDPLSAAPPPPPTDNPGESPLRPGEVGLLDPDGNPVATPSHLVEAMQDQGYLPDTPENRHQIAQRIKYGQGLGNELLAGTAGAARGASLGLSDVALTKSGAVDPETLDALQKYNPVSSAVGNVAGIAGATLLAPELGVADLLNPVSQVAKLGAGAAEALGGGTAARMAGSAVEGAFYGLGQSASESALGDPDLTAQKVMANVGLGAVLGGATSGVFQGIAGLGRKAAAAAGMSETGVLPKLNSYLLGTPEADTAFYAANQKAVNEAPEIESIKDAIDGHVSTVKEAFEGSQKTYDNALADVKAVKPDNALVTDLHASMQNQKAVLGEMSNKLDAVLDQSAIAVPRSDIEGAIDAQANALKVGGFNPFGSERTGVIRYLDGLKTQLEGLPEVLSGPDLRTVVRSLRDDAEPAYGLAPGEFAAGKARVAKSLAEGLNQTIKADPAADAILQQMRARSEALGGMKPYFGTPESALSSLQSAAGSSAKNELRTNALRAFDAATGENFVGRLKPFQDADQVLQGMKRSGATAASEVAQVANPGPELQALAAADAVHATNSDAWGAVKRLSNGRTQSVIKSYMDKTASATAESQAPNFSIEDKRALDHLASVNEPHPDLNGQSMFDAMQSRGVLDRFSKSKANGSRHALIFGTLGSAIGGVFGGGLGAGAGASLGAMAGGAVDRQGGLIAKKLIDATLRARNVIGNKGVTEAQGQFLLNRLGPAAINGMSKMMLSEVLNHLQMQSSQDPKQEQRAKSLGKLERHSNASGGRIDDHIQKFFTGGEVEARPEHPGETEKTMADVKSLAANPEALVDRVHAQTAPLADMAPKVTAGINDAAGRAIQYLAAKVPVTPTAYALGGKPPPLACGQVDKFKAALDTVNDPVSVLRHAKEGTLTSDHLEALNAVYPQLLSEMRAQAMHHVSTLDPDTMEFGKKALLSKFVGQPLIREAEPQQIASTQATMAQTMAQDQANQQQAQDTAKPSQKGLSKLSVSSRSQTDMQRSAARSPV